MNFWVEIIHLIFLIVNTITNQVKSLIFRIIFKFINDIVKISITIFFNESQSLLLWNINNLDLFTTL